MYAGAHVNVNWKANAVGCAHVRNANYDAKKKHILVVVELTQASPFQKTKAICVVESFRSTAAVQRCPKYLETDAIGKSEQALVGDKHNNTATSLQGLCCEVRVAVGPKARGRRKVPKDTTHKLDLVYTKKAGLALGRVPFSYTWRF
ncbi:hypothetical protein HRI_001912900 [Hibiscus trionum]|uniref:Uncharacterized protein n=1 Tax=Hibiscus trionum TaxID=183268 RepID=A0A9W7HSP0_HIBTR|nr:hypothetical protein HRI_001912900 [Hibiscus trionum]